MREVTDQTIKAEIASAEHGVVVDVWATWCSPCRVMLPLVEEVASENPDIEFLKAEVDQVRDFIAAHRIRSVPTLLFFKGGECVEIHSGALTLEQIRHKIREALS